MPGPIIQAQASSNIALIKYMGKNENGAPLNPSLSISVPELQSRVMLRPYGEPECTAREPFFVPKFSDAEHTRFSKHFFFLKQTWQIKGYWQVSSQVNFPPSCGMASSAASFAALTKACFKLAQHQNPNMHTISLSQLARLSAKGSGSSARSFVPGFGLWDYPQIKTLTPFDKFKVTHQCIKLSTKPKHISSSEAHKRVLSSPLFDGRPQRAKKRLKSLIEALTQGQLQHAFRICWEEFQDMHQLFHTAEPAFSYIDPKIDPQANPECLGKLKTLYHTYSQHPKPPLITLDAGPNIHLFKLER